MSLHLATLIRAREALLAARPGECEQAIIEFEALCGDDPPTAPVLHACHEQFDELRGLVEASADGVINARETLLQALETAGYLTTYDAQGARALRDSQRQSGPTY